MIANKEKNNILKQIYNISLLDEPINLETIDGIPPSRKLHTIYYNLIWGCELKIPKIDGFKSLLILLEYIYNKFSGDGKISPHLLSRKNEIFYLLIEQVLKISKDKNDNESLKSLAQYFYDPDFLGSFLLILNKLNNALFIKKYAFFSKIIKNALEDNLELCIIFKKRIINELFNKYDFIKTLMNENQKNTDNEDTTSDRCGNNNVEENKKKCIEIIERLKFIFDQFRNSYDNNLKNLAMSIDKYSMKRKIDIRADFKLVTKNIKENEALLSQRNKDIKLTLEELKYKLKGYSAKKESKEKIAILTEEKKLNEIKFNLDDNNNNKKIILLDNEKEKIIEINDAEKENPQPEKNENDQKDKVILLNDMEKEGKVTGKKRLREKKKKNKAKKESYIKKENFYEIKNKRNKKTLKENEKKFEIVESKENIEEINEEENEKIEQNEDKKDNLEEEKLFILGINAKSKKNEYKINMDNNKAQKTQNQKKEEKNSLIDNNKKDEENNHKNPKRGERKISKSSINAESLINGKKQKKKDKKKEISSLNKIKSKSSDNKKELSKSKSPQNKDDAKLSIKKDISKGSNKKKNNILEEKNSEKGIVNVIKEEVVKRESSRRIEKEKEFEIQIIEEISKSKNKKEMRLNNNKKNNCNNKLKEEKEDFDVSPSINLRNRVNNNWKNEQKKEILNKTNTKEIRVKSKLLNKDMKIKNNQKGIGIELKNKKYQKKEILIVPEIKTHNKIKEQLKKVIETNKINNNLLGKKRNNSDKRINLRNIVADEKKNGVKKSPPMTRRRK